MFEARVARLLAAFLLARIDGKSPVEYIVTDADKARVRHFARAHLVKADLTLDAIWRAWHEGFAQ